VIAAGEILWVDLDPTVGHEQAGHRPVLVISEDEVNRSTAIVVPLTTSDRPRPASHALTTQDARPSIALCNQVRTLDLKNRTYRRKGNATPADLATVRRIVGHLIGLY
jgi:mRNA interferase MazF